MDECLASLFQMPSAAAFHALRAEQAVTYRRRVVQPRRYTFMALVGEC